MQFKKGYEPPTGYAMKRRLVKVRQYLQERGLMGHFDFQLLGADGIPHGEIHKVVSVQGVCLLSHVRMDPVQVGHLCRLAQDTPDYPHDLCLWDGPDPNPTLVWSARIHWRMK